MKNAVFWNIKRNGSFKNRKFEGNIASIIRVTRVVELGTTLAVTSNRNTPRFRSNRLLVIANVVSCRPDDGGDTFLPNVGSFKSHTT
jgi:hypothetical protein